MKSNWDFVSLGSVAHIYNGNSINAEYKKKHFLGVDKGYPFIATKDVGFNGFIDYENGVKIPFDTDYKVADSDSVFICAEGGSAGKKIGYVTQQVCFGNKLFCIKPKQNILKGKYIYYYLQSVFFQIQFQSLLTGLIGGVSANKFKNISIPVPPLSEQERIVSLLDLEFAKIDAIKANAEKQLQDAKDLFQSALKDLLTPKEGWKSSKFGDVCEYYKEHGKWVNINYIGLENIDAHTGRLIDYKSSNEVESSTFKFNKGDVLYGRLRPYLQKVIIAPFDGCCSTEIFPIKSNAINNVYLKFWLLSDAVMDIMNESCSGCRMPRANMNSFKEEYIQYPSEQEQIIIANKLVDLQNKIGEIQFNYEQTIILCNDLKQSILKDIFG